MAASFLKVAALAVLLAIASAQDLCSQYSDCETCAQKIDSCVWCGDQGTCAEGTVIGPADQETCTSWQSGQCKLSGQTVMWVVLGVGLGLLLCMTCWIWYCCHKRNQRKKQTLLDDYNRLFDEQTPKESGKWSSTRDEMNAKYNINRTADDY